MATRAVLAPSERTKIVFGGALPRTPLGELTTLPRPPSLDPIPHSPRRLWRLDPQTIRHTGTFLSTSSPADKKENTETRSDTDAMVY